MITTLMEPGTVFSLAQSIEYADGAVVSKQLIKKKSTTITLFAFDKDQSLSEHTTPFDALAQVADGEAEFLIDGKPHKVCENECIILPANISHALYAIKRFKMLLTMIRE